MFHRYGQDIVVKYCRSFGSYLDVDATLHTIYGHSPHYFERRPWFRKQYYWCPGVEHHHSFYKNLGTVWNPYEGAQIVERCECGEERVRTIA